MGVPESGFLQLLLVAMFVICLSSIENLNAVFINDCLPQNELLEKLNKITIQQMNVLENVEDRRLVTE